MKTSIKLIISLFIVITAFSSNASADSTEKATVVRVDKSTSDLIVTRADGTKWLIQHNRLCTTMSTEFPVSLIITGDKITQLKVNFNEICKVYYAYPYTGDGAFLTVHKSENQIVADHEAEIMWNNKKYLIDFGKGCPYLFTYAGKMVYYNFSVTPDKGGTMILPGASGQCPITFTKVLETLSAPDTADKVGITGLQTQAQNNQVYLYWDKVTAEGKWFYVFSYSKSKLDLASYATWRAMPNARMLTANSYTVPNLGNGIPYNFYIAAVQEGKDPGPWLQATVTPIADPLDITKGTPDPDVFEVKMEEKTDSFRLYWPLREDARRYNVFFYVDGKREFYKILKQAQGEIIIKKDPKYLNKGLRLEVKTVPLPNKPHFSDGIYWVYKK